MNKNCSSIPSLVALRAFEAVARLGSFVRAADELHVTTSAISHQISTLEETLNVVLLNRTRGEVARRGRTEVTPAGKRLAGAVESALDQLAAACEDVRVSQARRTITVSANAPFCSLWLASRLASFAANQGGTDVRVIAIEDEPNLVEQKIDLAIVRVKRGAETSSTSQRNIALTGEVVFPVCSPLFLDKNEAICVDPAALARTHLLQEENTATPELNWDTWFGVLGVLPPPALKIVRYSGFSLVVGAAIEGGGVALGRSPLIDAELAAGRLVRLFDQHRLLGSWQFVLRMRQRAILDLEIQALITFLKAEVAKSPFYVDGGRVRGSSDTAGSA